MLRIRPTWTVLACTLFLNAAPVSISNDITNEAAYPQGVASQEPIGASFSTGGTAYNLTTVVVALSNEVEIDADPAKLSRPSHGFRGQHAFVRAAKAQKAKPSKVRPALPTPSTTVQLWSDNGGPGPGTLLATSTTTLSDASLGDDPAPFSFAFSNYPLAAGTRYWIEVVSGAGSVAVWWGTPDLTGTDVATEYNMFSGEVTANAPVGDPEDDGAFLMQVIGDPATPAPTPAPASVTLVLIGLASAAWYFRRRKALRSS
jgi:hypothetical protein